MSARELLENELNLAVKSDKTISSIRFTNTRGFPPDVFTHFHGYHKPTWAASILQTYTDKSIADNAFYGDFVYGKKHTKKKPNTKYTRENVSKVIEAFKRNVREWSEVEGEIKAVVAVHNRFLISEEEESQLDDFKNFLDIITSNFWLKKLTLMTSDKGASTLVQLLPFYKLSFQQLMLLDYAVALSRRCGLAKFTPLIMGWMSNKLGLSGVSSTGLKTFIERMSTMATGYTVPRQYGKTRFGSTLFTITLTCLPCDGLRMYYAAQKAELTSTMCDLVKNHAEDILRTLNKQNRERFNAKLMDAKKNKDGSEAGLYYYEGKKCAKKSAGDNTITINFYKKTEASAGDMITCKTEPTTFNRLICKPYKNLNDCRGGTYDFIWADETCFLRACFFNEIMSILTSKVYNKMICTSSQKTHQDKHPFVDLRTIRKKTVVTNDVRFVCDNHCVSLLNDKLLAVNKCPCNINSQATHTATGKLTWDLIQAFTPKSLLKDEEGDERRLDAMRSEIGVSAYPDMTDAQALDVLVDGESVLSELAEINFRRDQIDVFGELFVEGTTDENVQYMDTVLVYLDPTPASYKTNNPNERNNADSSRHAMSFVTSRSAGTYKSIILLAIEEFTTENLSPVQHDSAYTIANFFLSTVCAITQVYKGVFTRYILIPERCSFDMIYVWQKIKECIKTLAEKRDGHCFFKENSIVITAPCYIQKKVKNVIGHKRQREDLASEGRELSALERAAKQRRLEQGTHYDDDDQRMITTAANYTDALETIEQLTERLGDTHFRFGYWMPSTKNVIFAKFCTFMQSPSAKFMYASTKLISSSLVKAGIRDLDAMLNLAIAALKSIKISKKTSGKKKLGNGEYQCDDLGVSIIMSAMLYEDYANFNEKIASYTNDVVLVSLDY